LKRRKKEDLIPEVGVYDSAHEVTRGMCSGLADEVVTCYSFYPTKPVTSFEGGMICTGEREIADWCRKARYYGRNDTGTVSRNSWEYEIDFPGWKMNITEPQAAMALAQLRRLDVLEAERRRVVALYNRHLDECNLSTYLYRIEVDDRDEFIPWMRERGVECGVHFHPLHLFRAYRGCPGDDMSRCETVGRRTVSLPLYDSLADEDAMYVVGLVQEWRSRKGAV
jgi:dTDP-4-amino-4,6-dideoxygalactose transaminase